MFNYNTEIMKKLILFCLFTFNILPLGMKVTWEEVNWKLIKTVHFNVHFPVGYETFGKIAALYAEEANIFLTKKMSHNLSQVIPIYIYPSHAHFQTTNIISSSIGEGTGGFTESIKRRVVVPFMGSYDQFRHVLTHELVHAFQYDILLGSGFGGILSAQHSSMPPLWLIEGMAEYFSLGWEETADMTIRDAVLTGTMPTIEQMTFYQVRSGYMFYKGGQAVMKFIDETYGNYRIIELMKDFRDTKDLEDSIISNFGIKLEDFENKFQIWLKRKYYKDIHKKNSDEEGQLLTKHFKDKSYLNMHPVVSPNGKKIAYITIRNFFPVIIVKDYKKQKNKIDYSLKREEQDDENIIEIQSSTSETFYQLNLLNNRISFTPDSKQIFFSAKSKGKDRLYLYNIAKDKISKEFILPFDIIQFPQLSKNGKKAVFTGTISGKANIYLLNLKSQKLEKITDNYFYNQHPSLSYDNAKVIFSSNRNKENNFESTYYHIFEINLQNKKIKQITFDKGKQEYPSYIQFSDTKILYSANKNEIFNLFIRDLEKNKTYRLTNTAGGIFHPNYSDLFSKIIFTHYNKQGYDITIKKINYGDLIEDETIAENFNFTVPKYPSYLKGMSEFQFQEETIQFSPDWLFFGFQYSNYYGFGGFIQASMSDYTGNHKLHSFADYIQNRNVLNYQLTYAYLRKKIKFFAGSFRSSNFYSIFNIANISSINDLLYNPNFISTSVLKFGGFIAFSYPFTSFLRTDLQVEIFRYEETFYKDVPIEYLRDDIFTNFNLVSLGLTYNNVLYSMEGPLSGFHFSLSVEQNTNISGRDLVFSKVLLDFRKYTNFFRRYIVVNRFLAGIISNKDKDLFPFQIGGYNSLRGYPFLSIKGSKMFLINTELRFPLIDAILFGFPVQWVKRGFTGVIFLDIGTAFDEWDALEGYNTKSETLEDIYASYGVGVRMLLVPGLLIKIDWATPWDFKTSQAMRDWKGWFSLGYEF